MKIIKIQAKGNPEFLFNKVADVMRANRCPGKFYISEGDIEVNPWSEQVMNAVKKALHELKIKFLEIKG